ncbi:TetR/AcrR family transcriptional regulator [Gordonia sp. DT30]|uniref:TetR/AcrR family transcriptional regulator n=1 Tax=Gordonia sp. DT30 TaxID=3416546 RepID=UPI003CEC58E7
MKPLIVEQKPNRRGRPRDPVTERAILDAAFELVVQQGFSSVTMAAIIDRAGTSSATVYRRWPTKLDLVAAAIASRRSVVDDVDTGGLESDIESFLHRLAERMCLRPEDLGDALINDLRGEPGLTAAIAETMVAPRLQVIEAILMRARRRGELAVAPPSAAAYSLVVGPLVHLVQVAGDRPSAEFVTATVAGALAALRGYPVSAASGGPSTGVRSPR